MCLHQKPGFGNLVCFEISSIDYIVLQNININHVIRARTKFISFHERIFMLMKWNVL